MPPIATDWWGRVHASSPGTWLADLWAAEGLPFGLGHARSLQASPGGKATNDQSDSHQIAALRRGGMLPQASGDPAQRRATRDFELPPGG